jgi:23S rRNA pseudouridine2457 synthase
VRTRIGDWTIDGLLPGKHRRLTVQLPDTPPRNPEKRRPRRS